MRLAITTVAIVMLASCRASKTAQPRLEEYIESEYSSFIGTGTGAILGQAFLKTRGGDVKVGAGNPVYCHPVTSYSTEWYERSVLKREKLSEPDERVAPFTRQATCDGGGNFSFEGLPAGDYFLACEITWSIPAGYWSFKPTKRTGGVAHARVHVENGKTTRAIVTQ